MQFFLQELIFGSIDLYSLQRRVFNAVTFISACSALFITIQSILLELSIGAISANIVYFFIFGSVYFLSRNVKMYSWLIWLYLIVVCTAVLVDWTMFGGYTGLTFPVAIAVAGTMPFILPPQQIRYGFIMGCAFLLMIFIISAIFPDTIPVHSFTLNHTIDRVLNVGILGLGLAMLSYFVVTAYNEKTVELSALNKELESLYLDIKNKNEVLTKATEEIKTLRGIIPICSFCKQIRNDDGYYEDVDRYIQRHTEADFSHTVCPVCLKEEYPGYDD